MDRPAAPAETEGAGAVRRQSVPAADHQASDPGPGVDQIDAALPQTQCTRCGYPDCRGYAQAIAAGQADINRCPPGGAEGVRRLAALTGRPAKPLDPACGVEAPLRLALIDEAWCIGCTLCIRACPVDCIVGAPRRMHTILESWCTGCELCLPACPVDCIALVPADSAVQPPTGWAAWSPGQASTARQRYRARQARQARRPIEEARRHAAHAQASLRDLAGTTHDDGPQALERKRAVVQSALERARARLAGDHATPAPPGAANRGDGGTG